MRNFSLRFFETAETVAGRMEMTLLRGYRCSPTLIAARGMPCWSGEMGQGTETPRLSYDRAVQIQGLEVIFEDDSILVVNKPAGMLTIATRPRKQNGLCHPARLFE